MNTQAATAEPHRINYFLTLDELEKICKEEPASYLVDSLLPADDLHVAVGDSGIGKTPWAYQLGICVAAGVPFCGYQVKKGPVLYFDFENERDQKLGLGRSLCRHLGISGYPSDFHVLSDTASSVNIEDAIKHFRPVLAIIDTFYSSNPDVMKNDGGSAMIKLLNKFRATARTNHCAFLLVHHVRKDDSNAPAPSLANTKTLTWLHEASGYRILINMTHTRFALAEPPARGPGSDAALVMKVHVKLRGEQGPFYLERVFDEEGEANGYCVMKGVDLLGDPDQQEAYNSLPQTFRFKDAMRVYGKTDNPTNLWLNKCRSLGLVEKTAKGYRKTVAPELATATETRINPYSIPAVEELPRN